MMNNPPPTSINNNIRLEWIDVLKGIGILCIMLLHYENGIFPKWLDYLIGSFMITIFYVISGYIHAHKLPIPISIFIKKRFRQLMIPYFWFSLLIIIFDFILFCFNERSIIQIAQDAYYTVVFRGIGTLWFLPVLFVGETVFVVLRSRKRLIVYTAPMAVAILIFYAWEENVSLLNFDMITNACIKAPLLTIVRIINSVTTILCIYWLEGALGNSFRYSNISSFTYGFLMLLIGCICELMFQFPFQIDWIRTIFCHIAIPYGILLQIYALRKSRLLSPFAYFGKNSLIVMLTHFSFLLPLCVIINGSELIGSQSLLYFVVSVALEIPIIKLLNSHFSFLLGK